MGIDNPQLRNFCNDHNRRIADAFSQLERAAAVAVTTFDARGLFDVIETTSDKGAADTIVDGSDADGRTPVTGGDVYEMKNLCRDFAAFLTPERRAVIAKWRVNA